MFSHLCLFFIIAVEKIYRRQLKEKRTGENFQTEKSN